jgi:regulator of sigma E protease
MCGVKVESFSIGFGKEIFGWTDKNGTRWKFSMIPLGGYVQMFGDVDPASSQHAEGVQQEGGTYRPFTTEEKKVAFYSQPVIRRAAIVVAGPAINYIFAIVLLTGLFIFEGQPYAPPVATKLVEGDPAMKAGFQVDDRIVSINGKQINRFQDLAQIITINLDSEMDVELAAYVGDGKWSEETRIVKVAPKRVTEEDRFGFRHTSGRIGIIGPKGQSDIREHTVLSAIGASFSEVYEITGATLKALGQMIMGFRSTDELGGILRIGAYAGQFAQAGLISLITFSALLSVNLGFINLLPIPMLDGGHLAFYAMESLRGKPLGERAQEYALRVGMLFLMGIMVFATWNDLVQLKVVDYVKNLIS